MTAESICWLALAIMAGCAVFVLWLVFYVTRAPIMELHCPKCGVVYGHDKHGNCIACGLGVQLWDRKGGGE
jgi:hypothetical protein